MIGFPFLDPINLVLVIVSGVAWSIIFREWEIDRRTVILAITFFVPLTIGRLVYVAAGGEIYDSGLRGTIFFILYFISAALTRWVLRGRMH